jgi:hypothetical protein
MSLNTSKSTSTSSHLTFQENTIFSRYEHNIEGQFHTPTHTRKSTRRISQLEPDTTALWGWFILFSSYFIFVFSLYAIVVSKFVPETGNKVNK